MRVVMVGPYPDPGCLVGGGVERVIETLSQQLSKELEVIIVAPNSLIDGERSLGNVRIRYLRRTILPGTLRYWTVDSARLAGVINELCPDIVHYQGAAGISRAVSCRGILTVHGFAHREVRLRRGAGFLNQLWGRLSGHILKVVERKYRARIASIVMINPYVADVLPDVLGLTRFAIPNPVDPIFIETPINCSPRSRRIVSVGRVGALKRTAHAVELVCRVIAGDPDAEAVFYGRADSQEYLSRCRAIVGRHGLEGRVAFPGNVNASALCKALDQSSVLLITSAQENAPVSLAEACARGVAVVAPSDFGIRYMIEAGVNGEFLPVDGIDSEVRVLAESLERAWDRVAIARRAQTIYSIATISRDTVNAYRAVLGQ